MAIDGTRNDRVINPLKIVAVDVLLGAVRPLVERALCSLISNARFDRLNGTPSVSLSRKYWRISGLIFSRAKRILARMG